MWEEIVKNMKLSDTSMNKLMELSNSAIKPLTKTLDYLTNNWWALWLLFVFVVAVIIIPYILKLIQYAKHKKFEHIIVSLSIALTLSYTLFKAYVFMTNFS